MPIFKDDNNTIQVEFGSGDVIPLTIGLPQPEGRIVPAMVILPTHEAMTLSDPSNQRQFHEFDVRMIFTNTNQIEFMQTQLNEARRILLLSEEAEENTEEEAEV